MSVRTPLTRAQRRRKMRGLDNSVVECRGDHHPWPVLKIGPLPKGIKAVPQREGGHQLEITCPNCGRVRVRTLSKGNVLERGGKRYAYHGGWDKTQPDLTRADFQAELDDRMMEVLAVQDRETRAKGLVPFRAPAGA